MAAYWLWARSDWRSRWPALVALTVLLAVAGGSILAAVAAARRTDTAFDRFRAAVHDGDVVVSGFTDDGLVNLDVELLDEVANIDGVVEATAFSVMAVGLGNSPDYFSPARVASRGERGRQVIVEGRAFDPGAPDEVMVNEVMRDALALEIGDRVELTSLTQSQWERAGPGQSIDVPTGPTIEATVVGVNRDVEAISDAPFPFVVLTTAFWSEYRDEIGHCLCFMTAHTEPEARDDVLDEVAELFGDGSVDVSPAEPYGARVRDTIDLQRGAFWLMAAAAAIAGIVVIGVASSRLAAGREIADGVWMSLGFGARRLVIARVVAQAPAVVAGAAGSAVVAYLLSPLAPVGLSRRAEPDPGFRADWPVLGPGAAAFAVATLVCCLGSSAWAGRAVGATPGVAGLSSVLPPSPRFGLRAVALSGKSGVVGAGIGAAGVAAALTLQASIGHLLDTPRLYGADYDAHALQIDAGWAAARDQLLADPDIAALAEGWTTADASDARVQVTGPTGATGVFPDAFVPVTGGVGPVLAEGRAPAGRDEVAAGRALLSRLGARVGDTVTATGAHGPVELRVVGVTVQAGFDESDLGFTLTFDGLEGLGRPLPFALYIRFADGADLAAMLSRAERSDARERATEVFGLFDVPRPSSEVGNIGQLGQLPVWTALMLSALGAAAVLHALAVTLRRWRRELAIHRALGFTRRQALGAVCWAGAFTGTAGAVWGLPFGVIAGRVIHGRLVAGVGAVTEPIVPTTAWLAAGAALALCVVASLPAALSAVRQRPAVVLRSE